MPDGLSGLALVSRCFDALNGVDFRNLRHDSKCGDRIAKVIGLASSKGAFLHVDSQSCLLPNESGPLPGFANDSEIDAPISRTHHPGSNAQTANHPAECQCETANDPGPWIFPLAAKATDTSRRAR